VEKESHVGFLGTEKFKSMMSWQRSWGRNAITMSAAILRCHLGTRLHTTGTHGPGYEAIHHWCTWAWVQGYTPPAHMGLGTRLHTTGDPNSKSREPAV